MTFNNYAVDHVITKNEMSKSVALVVDDEKNLCYLLKNFLSRMNYNVTCNYTLSDATASFKSINPNFVLLDIHLPDGLGLKLLDLIKTTQPNTTVVMMSSKEDFNDEEQRIMDKADYFLKKPFPLHEIQHVMNRFS